MTEQLPINKGKTDFEQPLPIYLNNLQFYSSLPDRPSKLKEFVQNYMKIMSNNAIFDLQKRHT